MRTATIDYVRGQFHVTVYAAGRRVCVGWGGYREVIAQATEAGVPRSRVTLTAAAQEAAVAVCFGSTP